MENYTPEWWNKGELADVVRRSRLVTVEAHGVYLESIECRHRAAVLRDGGALVSISSLNAARPPLRLLPQPRPDVRNDTIAAALTPMRTPKALPP
jgi:hypothetical protein